MYEHYNPTNPWLLKAPDFCPPIEELLGKHKRAFKGHHKNNGRKTRPKRRRF